MKRLTALLITAFATLLGINGASAQDGPPTFTPFEIIGCNFIGNNEMSDLTPVIEGKASSRPPIGFWFGLQGGQSTWSDRILKAVMQTQQAGEPTPHPERLRKDIDEYPQFPEDKFIGHAAWLDWPWKLHRKEKEGVNFELYNLVDDPMEATDLAKNPEHEARVKQMQTGLANWQLSVTRSLNGKDYEEGRR